MGSASCRNFLAALVGLGSLINPIRGGNFLFLVVGELPLPSVSQPRRPRLPCCRIWPCAKCLLRCALSLSSSPLMLWPPYGQFLFPPTVDRVALCFRSPKAKKYASANLSKTALFSFLTRHINGFGVAGVAKSSLFWLAFAILQATPLLTHHSCDEKSLFILDIIPRGQGSPAAPHPA